MVDDGCTGATYVDYQIPINGYRAGGDDHDLRHARGEGERYTFEKK